MEITVSQNIEVRERIRTLRALIAPLAPTVIERHYDVAAYDTSLTLMADGRTIYIGTTLSRLQVDMDHYDTASDFAKRLFNLIQQYLRGELLDSETVNTIIVQLKLDTLMLSTKNAAMEMKIRAMEAAAKKQSQELTRLNAAFIALSDDLSVWMARHQLEKGEKLDGEFTFTRSYAPQMGTRDVDDFDLLEDYNDALPLDVDGDAKPAPPFHLYDDADDEKGGFDIDTINPSAPKRRRISDDFQM